MPPTTPYRRGDVVLLPFPFTDLSGVKQRPALVISSDARNATRPDVVVVAITSQVPANLAGDELLVPAGDLAPCGLLKASVVKTGKIVTIHQALVRKRLGTMPSATVRLVLEAVRSQFAP